MCNVGVYVLVCLYDGVNFKDNVKFKLFVFPTQGKSAELLASTCQAGEDFYSFIWTVSLLQDCSVVLEQFGSDLTGYLISSAHSVVKI